MTKGRKKDHVWKLVKFRGDIAIYALCSCGFCYACSNLKKGEMIQVEIKEESFYRYCPNCGARKTLRTDDIKKIDKSIWAIKYKE